MQYFDMDKKFDVVALGEVLIDFTENGESEQNNSLFEANPGGAPCNVLAMLKKLNKKCAFIGKVGNDMFGKLLTNVMDQVGIYTDGVVVDSYYNTTLAFVKNFENGDRDFSFYRHPGADMMLSANEVPLEIIQDAKIFHFGTLSMTSEEVREATKKAIRFAKEKGLIISFDPNYRPPLWESEEYAKEQIEFGLSKCDILKIADNEIYLLTGLKDFDKAAAFIKDKYPNIKVLNITAGENGSYSYYQKIKVYRPVASSEGVIETTGAGDTFCACVLYYILEHGIDNLTTKNLEEMLTFANAAAYLVTTKKGAIRSMPEKEQVEKVIAGVTEN